VNDTASGMSDRDTHANFRRVAPSLGRSTCGRCPAATGPHRAAQGVAAQKRGRSAAARLTANVVATGGSAACEPRNPVRRSVAAGESTWSAGDAAAPQAEG